MMKRLLLLALLLPTACGYGHSSLAEVRDQVPVSLKCDESVAREDAKAVTRVLLKNPEPLAELRAMVDDAGPVRVACAVRQVRYEAAEWRDKGAEYVEAFKRAKQAAEDLGL